MHVKEKDLKVVFLSESYITENQISKMSYEVYPVIEKYFVSSTRMKSEDVLYVQRTLNRLAAARR